MDRVKLVLKAAGAVLVAVGVALFVSTLCPSTSETCTCDLNTCHQRGGLTNQALGGILFFIGGFLIAFSETSALEQFRFDWAEARKAQQEDAPKSDAR